MGTCPATAPSTPVKTKPKNDLGSLKYINFSTYLMSDLNALNRKILRI
jgi:hypothetical protein